MKKRESAKATLEKQWGDSAEVERILLAGSNLPGPRGNLELAAACADVLASRGPASDAWALALRWASIDAVSGPVNHPREFLPFCGVLGLGAMFGAADATQRDVIEARITSAALDDRWRMREAAAMSLQRVAEIDFDAVSHLVRRWLDDGDPALLRGAIAALADPPLLAKGEDRAGFALEIADRVCETYANTPARERAAEPWRILRKGLEYAPSVFVAAAPKAGFSLLRRWAESRQLDVRKIVVSNLRKTRLARAFPDEVESVGQALAWSDESFTDP